MGIFGVIGRLIRLISVPPDPPCGMPARSWIKMLGLPIQGSISGGPYKKEYIILGCIIGAPFHNNPV